MIDPNQQQNIDTKMNGGVVKTTYELDYAGISLFMLLFIAIGALYFSLTGSDESNSIVVHQGISTEEPTKPQKDFFSDIEIEGIAAYVFDIESSKQLFARNEEEQLPLASITKLMTVAAASEYIALDDTLIVMDQNLYEEGDSGLLAFEEWNAKDLIDFTLMVSSNDGADVLANAAGAAKIVRSGSQSDSSEDVFIEEMNRLADEIGLKQTYFINETGLDPTKATSGGYGSARDSALLMSHIISSSPELLESTIYPTRDISSLSNFDHVATNTNQSVGNIPGLIASKTGFTDLAGGNLVVAFDAGINRPVVISVLGSTLEGRFTDVEKLVHASIQQINQ